MTGKVDVRARVLLAVTAGAVLLAGSPAVGDDHRPPEVFLRVGERQQVGPTSTGLWSTCGAAWTWDPAPYPYPQALRVPPNDVSARIVFQKEHAPENLTILGWTAVETERRGRRAFPYTLRPVEEGGQVVAWLAEFSFRVRKHLYLDVSAEWMDQEGPACRGGQQNATWNFHVKNRRA